MTDNLRKKVTKSVGWVGAATLFVTIANFLIIAFLGRLLSPQEFGLVSMVLIVVNLLQVFSDFGLTSAIIQKQNLVSEQLSTLFFFNCGLGLILFCLGFTSAPWVADFFNFPELTGFIKVISCTFIFIAAGQMFKALLQKELNFRGLFILDVLSNFIYAFSTIMLAFHGFGVQSLIYGFLFFQLSIILIAVFLNNFRPQLVFKPQSILDLLQFGGYITGEKFLNYLNRNLDNIIVGRYLGAQALGYYSLAYMIMLVPVSRITGVIMLVVFPAFSKIQSDDDKIKSGYLRVTKCISLITFPLMAGLFIYAEELIFVIFGETWFPVIPLIKILCIVGALQSIGSTVGTILYVKGRPDIAFKWNIFVATSLAIAFWVGKGWGIIGVATMYTIFSVCFFPIIQRITNNLIHIKMKDFLVNFFVPLKLAFIVSLIAGLHKYWLAQQFHLNHIQTLLSGIFICLIIYGFYVYKYNRDLIGQVMTDFR